MPPGYETAEPQNHPSDREVRRPESLGFWGTITAKGRIPEGIRRLLIVICVIASVPTFGLAAIPFWILVHIVLWVVEGFRGGKVVPVAANKESAASVQVGMPSVVSDAGAIGAGLPNGQDRG